MKGATEDFASTPLPRAQLFAAIVCALVLGADLAEIAIGNALAAIFSAAPYHLGAQTLSWLLASVYIGAIVGAPTLGWLADRYGLKPIVAAALGWLGLISGATAADPVLNHLPVLRLLAGLSLGALPPLIITYLTGISGPHSRGRLILWVSAFSFLAGPATVFAIRALIQTRPFGVEGWRWPFAAAGGLALILSAVFRYLPEPRPSSAGFDPRTTPMSNPAGHAIDLKRRFAFLGSIYFLQPWATAGFSITVGPTLLQRGYDLTHTLFYVGMNLFGPTVTTFAAGAVADRFDRRYALVGGCAAMLVACVMFFGCHSPALLLISVLLFGVAGGFYLPLMTIYGAEIFPREVRGSASTGAWALNRVAAFLVPLALVPLVQDRGNTAVAAAICAALLLAAGLLIRFGPRGSNRVVLQ